MPVSLAIFDIAGTTVEDNDFVARAFISAFQHKGIQVRNETVNPLMGYHKPLAIEMVLKQSGKSFDSTTIADIHEVFEEEMKSFYADSAEVKPFRHTEDVFNELKRRNILIALNSGFSRDIADIIVKRFKWKEKGMIDDYIASDEVDEGRPSSLMIHTLMNRHGISDSTTVAKIGDTVVDIEEGINSGCKYIIAVTTGATERQYLALHHPTHIVDDILEVTSIIA